MEEVVFKGEVYLEVEMYPTPQHVNVAGIELNRCSDNSKLIVEQNEGLEIKYVEGFMMIFEGGIYKNVAHVWCCLDGQHFDATGELFERKRPDLPSMDKTFIPYGEVEINDLPEMQKGIQPYTEDFIEFTREMDAKYPLRS